MKTKSLLALGAMLLLPPLAANAGLVQVYSATGVSGVDAAFENIGGYLQTTYSLPSYTLPNGTTSTTVLPPLERAVAQLASNNANGLHLPNAPTPSTGSGIPGVAYPITGGGSGLGVYSALTNFAPLANGSGSVSGSLTSFVSGTPRAVGFTFSRTGNVITYTAGDNSVFKTWVSNAQSYFADVNALEFRLRSTTGNTESLTNLLFNSQSLADLSASNGNVTIALFSGVSGDFTLSGTFNYSGTGGFNHQIKGLSLPDATKPDSAVPEPSTIALLAIGAVGFRTRLRRKA
jgi:hypothetical protein